MCLCFLEVMIPWEANLLSCREFFEELLEVSANPLQNVYSYVLADCNYCCDIVKRNLYGHAALPNATSKWSTQLFCSNLLTENHAEGKQLEWFSVHCQRNDSSNRIVNAF